MTLKTMTAQMAPTMTLAMPLIRADSLEDDTGKDDPYAGSQQDCTRCSSATGARLSQ